MALNIFSELNVSSGGDKITAGFTRCKSNWAVMDTELHNARGGESTLDTRLDIMTSYILPTISAWFYANTAPTGWTITSGPSDMLIAVKGGSVYTAGAVCTEGTWTQPNHLHTMNTHTHTLSAHTHSVDEHNHKWQDQSGGTDGWTLNLGLEDQSWAENGSQVIGLSASALYTKDTDPTCGVPSADLAVAKDPGDTANGAEANTWRPAASVGIIATMD
jgi:hypothetical protein